MAWLEQSQVLAKWKAVELTEAGVPAAEFLNAARAIISLFDLISGMGIVKGDMVGNADTLEKLLAGRSLALQEMVETELKEGDAAKLAKSGKTATCALLWLTRALIFIRELLQELLDKPAAKLTECLNAGYERSLKQYHGFAIRTTFSVAVKAAPTRETLFAKMGPSEDVVMKSLSEVVPLYTKILEVNTEFLSTKGIDK